MLNLSPERIDSVIKHQQLYSLRAIKSPRAGFLLARWLLVFMGLFILFLFLPWQQNIRGSGKVTALNPANRPQTVQTVIAGQIKKWHVREGQYVRRNDTIVTITEVKEKYFDPQLLLRLREQLEAKKNGLQSKDLKAQALERQISALRTAMNQKVEQSKAKLSAEQTKFQNAENQYQRNKLLYEAGNIPLTKFQEIEYKYQGSSADYQNALIEINRVQAEYLEKISKSESDLNNTRSEIFDAQGEISKMTNEYANMRIRSGQYSILAPQDGYVVRAMLAGIGETVKEGESVCTVMPEASDIAVEMYIKAMDVPLVSKGRHVRIMFDGWPALQFSGWPSVSVGTFGGKIEVIDFVASEPGTFRVLITPDKSDETWPAQLRVGSGTKGWVMLDNVPVWYEIWRQLNGFPPSLYDSPLEDVIPPGKDKMQAKEE